MAVNLTLLSHATKSGEGHYGVIYGDREDTARYAVTTRNNDECLGVMINLSQLDKFIKGQYSIYNCRLVFVYGKCARHGGYCGIERPGV